MPPAALPFRFPRDVPRLGEGDVVLRAPVPEDVRGVVEQCTDPVSIRWTTVPLHYDPRQAQEFLGSVIGSGWESGEQHVFVVEATRDDGTRGFGGTLGLERLGQGRWEIAFGAHPGVRGRGVMTTAVRLLLDWGFETLDPAVVLWQAHAGNWASRRIAWRAGFRIADGVLPSWLPQRGELRDAWLGTLAPGEPRGPRTPWLDAVPLSDGAVRLRPVEEEDLPRLVETCDSEEARAHLPFLPSPYTLEDARQRAGAVPHRSGHRSGPLVDGDQHRRRPLPRDALPAPDRRGRR